MVAGWARKTRKEPRSCTAPVGKGREYTIIIRSGGARVCVSSGAKLMGKKKVD